MSTAVSKPLASSNGSVTHPSEAPSVHLPPHAATHQPAEPAKGGKAKSAQKDSGIFRSRSGLFKKRSELSEDVRRDSGLAPSLSVSVDQSALMDGSSYSSATGVAPPSSAGVPVPSITINDENRTEAASERPLDASQPATHANMEPAAAAGNDPSFNALQTDIPRGSMEDPFSSDLQFTNRGSVLLSGSDADAFAQTLPKSGSVKSALSSKRVTSAAEAERRSISADDRRLSRRVRSYYEPSTEVVAEESEQLATINSNSDTKSEEKDTLTDLQGTTATQLLPRHPSRAGKRVSIRLEPNEAAGGIEDWTDVDSRDVDRFGFIKSRPTSSKRSSVNSTQPPGSSGAQNQPALDSMGSQAVEAQTTGEQGNSRASKKNRLSLTPGSKTLRPSPSLLSSRSRASTASKNPFKSSKNQPRWLADAPDMLMPLPGLGEEEVEPDLNPARESRRADKWQKMAKPVSNPLTEKGAGTKYTFQMSDPKLISRVWKGIPDRWRSQAWHSFLSSSATKRSTSSHPQPSDEELEKFFADCQAEDCADDMQIDMDVPRTIGNHLQFRKRYHGGQRFLFRVLRALSMYFPDTGYVQGMASVVATLLVYYDESRAFVMAVRLWQLRGVGSLYTEGFEGLMSALKELEERWIKNTEVAKQLDALGISASAWGPKWYLTVFNYVLPFHTMLRVWDVFMLMGDSPSTPSSGAVTEAQPNLDVLHAVSAAVLSALRDTIVDAEFENAMRALTSSVNVGKDDKLMNIARKLYEQKKKR